MSMAAAPSCPDRAMTRALVVGCGKLGLPLARLLIADGHSVTGIRRTLPETPDSGDPVWLKADVTNDDAIAGIPTDFELVVIILTPAERSPEGYRRIYQEGLDRVMSRLAAASIKPRLLFVSATSVYAQHRGEWVDEQSVTAPETYNGQSLLAAERAVKHFNPQSAIVRFSGIYGAQRQRLLKTLEKPQQIQRTPPLYTNRIHQQDCIAVLHLLAKRMLEGTSTPPVVAASDHDPAPRFEVMHWLAERAGLVNPTPASGGPDADQNKRVRNSLLLNLGFTFTYPTYRDGYDAMLG